MGVQNKLTSEEKDLFIPTEKPEKVTKKIKTNKTSDPWEEQLKLLVLMSLYDIKLPILSWQLEGSFFVWSSTQMTDFKLIWVLD